MQVEQAVLSSGPNKKLVLVLNKIGNQTAKSIVLRFFIGKTERFLTDIYNSSLGSRVDGMISSLYIHPLFSVPCPDWLTYFIHSVWLTTLRDWIDLLCFEMTSVLSFVTEFSKKKSQKVKKVFIHAVLDSLPYSAGIVYLWESLSIILSSVWTRQIPRCSLGRHLLFLHSCTRRPASDIVIALWSCKQLLFVWLTVLDVLIPLFLT